MWALPPRGASPLLAHRGLCKGVVFLPENEGPVSPDERGTPGVGAGLRRPAFACRSGGMRPGENVALAAGLGSEAVATLQQVLQYS